MHIGTMFKESYETVLVTWPVSPATFVKLTRLVGYIYQFRSKTLSKGIFANIHQSAYVLNPNLTLNLTENPLLLLRNVKLKVNLFRMLRIWLFCMDEGWQN